MTGHRFALWLLDRFDCSDFQESLVGDLLEEIARGRSLRWVWQEVLACCGFALARRMRLDAFRQIPFIAAAFSLCLLGAASIAPLDIVFETWGVIYLVSGTCSLFGHMIFSHTSDSHAILFPFDAD